MAKTSSARSGQVIRAMFPDKVHAEVGMLVGVDEDGTARVDFPGNTLGALPARLAYSVASAPRPVQDGPLPVVIVFEDGDRARPLILALIAEKWIGSGPVASSAPPLQRERVIEGESLLLKAGQELILRCGNASVQLRRDGKLVIKGTELVSRASGTNKIKGGVVNIN